MSTEVEHAEFFAALAMPFDGDSVRHISRGGRQLAYVTARTVANRLDEVCGPASWRVSYRETAKGVVCTIGIRVDGEWIEKSDAGGYAGMVEKNREGEFEIDEENDVKTAYSDSFKRAGSMWGIARYLYNDGVPAFAQFAFTGAVEHYAYPEPPRAPAASNRAPARTVAPARNAAPARSAAPARNSAPAASSNGGGRAYGPPTSGKGLFAWAATNKVVDLVNAIGEREGYGSRMVDWSREQVEFAYAEASLPADDGGEEPPV